MCLLCGREHTLKKEKCPAWGTKCLNCGGRNHFAKVCRKPKKAQRPDSSIKQIETEEVSESADSDSSDVDFITRITTTISAVNSGSSPTSGYAKEIYTVMEIGNHAVTFQIDCGASINIITEALMCHHADIKTARYMEQNGNYTPWSDKNCTSKSQES